MVPCDFNFHSPNDYDAQHLFMSLCYRLNVSPQVQRLKPNPHVMILRQGLLGGDWVVRVQPRELE